MLEKEFQYYLTHQDDLIKQYNSGKYVVIAGQEVVGVYDDDLIALIDTRKTREQGTFLIQKCTPGKDDYTSTFHSRVSFA
jgi:hypothetical protein